MGSSSDDANSKKFQDEHDRMCKHLDNVKKKQALNSEKAKKS